MNTLSLAKKWKNKFQDVHSKVYRICQETGKVDKLDALLYRNSSMDMNSIRFVSSLFIAIYNSWCFLKDGWSPLHISILYGHEDLAEHLITKLRADVVAVKDKDAASKKYGARMDGLLDDVRCTPLHVSCWIGSLKISKLIIEKRANIDYTTSVYFPRVHIEPCWFYSYCCQSGYTALHFACWNGNVNLVKYLVEKRASRSTKSQVFFHCFL